MHIRLDQGVYRHLEFRQADGSWNHGFHIITTPWRLMVTGDMGTWVFSRLEDMFEFFRTDKGRINCSYWAEKCINGVHGGSEAGTVYDGDVYQANIIDSLSNYSLSASVRSQIKKEIKEIDFSDEYSAVDSMRSYKFYYKNSEKRPFHFQEVWEVSTKTYGYHFIWCLYAIAWSIQQYDAAKVEVAQ